MRRTVRSAEQSEQKDNEALLREVLRACEALEVARNISAAHATATGKIEANILRIEAEIAQQEEYLGERKAAEDLVVKSLKERHANLCASRETLRAHAAGIEQSRVAAQHQVEELERLCGGESSPVTQDCDEIFQNE